jgi:hypothetical protein
MTYATTMFVRFRQTAIRLGISLVETHRQDGRVRHQHVASLGSIVTEPTIADRIAFWQRVNERLEALGNRIGPEAAKIIAALHGRVPIPTIEEQRELKLENARADERFFQRLADWHEAHAADHKALAAAANARSAGDEAAASANAQRATEARERIERIEAGDEVPGGFGKPIGDAEMMSILKAAGLTAADIRHIRLQHELIELIGSRLGEAGVQEYLMTPQTKVAIAAWERAHRKYIRTFARFMFADGEEDNDQQ